MNARRLLHGLAVFGGLALTAFAGDETQVLTENSVRVHAWSPWPARVNKGSVPIFIELENTGDARREIEVEAKNQAFRTSIALSQRVTLDAGQSVRLEWLAPTEGSYPSTYDVEATCRDENVYLSAIAGSGANSGMNAVLSIAPDPAPAGTAERWTAEISTEDIDRPGWVPPGTTPTVTNDNLQFEHTTFEQLPAQWAAYTSLDLVVLDASQALPPQPVLDPLMAWVRSGGQLLVLGEGVRARCAEQPSIAEWLEPRFADSLPSSASSFRAGLGRISLLETSDYLEDTDARDVVRTLATQRCGMSNDPQGSRTQGLTLSIPGVGEVPFRIFAVLLVLFAVVLGPVNFIFVARAKRPVLLLVTIPATALALSLVLLAYGVVFQGLDVKSGSLSLSLIDQRTHRGTVIEKRLMYAGLAPSDGLRPENGTVLLSLSEHGFVGVRSERLEIEHRPEVVLTADYLPTRVQALQLLQTERAERARLDIARRGATYEVTNNLGARLTKLVLRDAKGEYFLLDEALAAGARAELVACPADDGEGRIALSPEDAIAPYPTAAPLAAASYLGELETLPFRDSCGIELNEIEGRHRVYGVFGLDEEAWR